MSMTDDIMKAKKAEAVRNWRKRNPDKQRHYQRNYRLRHADELVERREEKKRKKRNEEWGRQNEWKADDRRESAERNKAEKERYEAIQRKLEQLEKDFDAKRGTPAFLESVESYYAERNRLMNMLKTFRNTKRRNDNDEERMD